MNVERNGHVLKMCPKTEYIKEDEEKLWHF